MNTLRMLPLLIVLSACSTVELPLSPYRIDVQQGNVLEQESVDKLKLGMTPSQVRFLLGTPLLIDPFHKNRWDYVYNFRKSGTLTEKRRLVLYFEGDVLKRIEADGFPDSKGVNPVAASQPKTQTVPVKPAVSAPSSVPVSQPQPKPALPPVVVVAPTPPKPAEAPSVQIVAPAQPSPSPVLQVQPAPTPAPQPVAASVPVQSRPAAERGLDNTSIVPPMVLATSPAPVGKPSTPSARPPESVSLQAETNVAVVVPDTIPIFPEPPVAAPVSTEDQLKTALEIWANAWRSRDEETYFGAYAANFKPHGGLSRAEWEKRRRLLLGTARNINLTIDGHAFEVVTEDSAQVSFRQFYSSDSFRDAVIKQIKFVRVDNLWLIEEEKVLAPIKATSP